MGLHRVTVLANEAGTAATRTSDKQVTPSHVRGIYLRVQVGTITGTPTFTPTLKRVALDGSEDAVWTAAAAISTASTATYIIYPGASGGDVTEVDGIPVPQQWKLVLTFGSTGSAATEADIDYLH